MKDKVMTVIIAILLVIVIALLLIVYFNNNKVNNGAETNIKGTVTNITINGNVGFIYVEGTFSPESDYDKASIKITEDTVIEKDNVKVTINDIKEGDLVKVTFTGPVAESYPVQATASYINIF